MLNIARVSNYLVSVMILSISCSVFRTEEEAVTLQLVEETEKRMFVLISNVETYWWISDQRVFFPDFLKEDSKRRLNWGMKEVSADDLSKYVNNFESIPPINDEELPSIEEQKQARMDPFSPENTVLEYAGHPETQWYIIRSCGPDEDKDLPLQILMPGPVDFYLTERNLGKPLPCYQYDPTNGIISSGDMLFWRDARWGLDLAIHRFPPYCKDYQHPGLHLWDLR